MSARPQALPLVLVLLYATAPVLTLYASNAGQVRLSETALPIGVLTAVSLALLPLFAALFRGALRGSALLTILLLLCFSYGHVAAIVGRHPIAGMNPANPKLLVPATLLLGALCALAIRRTRNQPRVLAQALAVAGVAMLGTSLVNVVRHHSGGHRRAPATAEAPERVEAGAVVRRPDIYYIVFDRYASNATLRARYGFDNTPLLDFLRARGFYVAGESRSNYLPTAQSLASSLNMSHLLNLTRTVGAESSDWVPVFDMLAEHRVGKFLTGQGYRYVHIGSGWQPTAANPMAAVNYRYTAVPEFTSMLISTTAFYPVLYRLGVTDPLREKHRRIGEQLDLLPAIARGDDHPRFVFAHFLTPHGAYVFNRDGSYRTPERNAAVPEGESYVEQIRYLNTRIPAIIDAILKAYPPGSPPVIIIQGDEGPYPTRTQPHSFQWDSATDDEINEKMRILDAIYAPGCESQFYPTMTPVNTFRILFNCYFHTGLELLPDRSYAYRNLKRLYDFVETTERFDAPGR